MGSYSVADRITQYGKKVEKQLLPFFQKQKVTYPPNIVTLVFSKEDQTLDLYAGESESSLRFIKSYPVLAASGGSGPKLKEGDKQVPEGIYQIELLNPNSRFHLSLRVNYPNASDQEEAKKEGRTRLGGDIMIHGNQVSIGCIAIGDLAIEEVFILATQTNYKTWKVLLSPCSSHQCWQQKRPLKTWIQSRYQELQKELSQLPQKK